MHSTGIRTDRSQARFFASEMRSAAEIAPMKHPGGSVLARGDALLN